MFHVRYMRELFPFWGIKVPHMVQSPQVPLLPTKLNCTSRRRLFGGGGCRWTRGHLTRNVSLALTFSRQATSFSRPRLRPRDTCKLSRCTMRRGAAWNKEMWARRNKCTSLDPVAASYKIKARKASSTTRRKLSAQQLRTGHGWARERQLGTMVDTQFLFALLRWWSSPSNQTMSRHRVSLQHFASFYIHRLPATIRLERHRLSWHIILSVMSNEILKVRLAHTKRTNTLISLSWNYRKKWKL